jgi:hypothetical protein
MRWTWLIFIGFLISCSNQHHGASSPIETKDVEEIQASEDADAEVQAEDVEEDPYSIWTDPCIDCKWYFCPPLDAVWQKQICVNSCDEPPTIAYESDCIEYLQCDPTQTLIEVDIPCITTDGFPGTQDKICEKGQIKYTNCETNCDEEICDGEDNDCDGQVDEGFSEIEELCNNIDDNCNGIVDEGAWECDEGCGAAPNLCVAGEFICTAPLPEEEICDGIDNDCDGETDEGQLNDCGQCGLEPEEICDGIDNNCDGDIDEGLIQPCGTACGEGYETCVDGMWVSCTAPPEFIEICDGIDNNCDGQIDEGLQCICTIQDVGALFPCQEPPLLCGKGYKTCECLDPTCETIYTTDCFAICHWLAQPIGSDLQCDPLVGMPLQEEECNNFDDNCNQLIDEDLFAGCYTGPEGTIGVGICKPGEMTCDVGVWGNESDISGLFTPGFCKDEITPQVEICNGVDDDCDGETDWGKEIDDTDILFIVDWSGSMIDEQSAMLIALNQFAATFSDEDVLQWGLVLGPRGALSYDEYLELYHDLTGFTEFLTAMSVLNPFSMGGGQEMLLDAIYLSVQNISAVLPKLPAGLEWDSWGVVESIPHHDDFLIDWRPGVDKIIIVFTDEHPQSYMSNVNGKITVGDVKIAVQNTPQLKLYVFSTNTSWQWDELAVDGGGKYFELTNNPTEMYNSLMEILDELCKSGGEDAE